MKKNIYMLLLILGLLSFAGCQQEEKPDTENTRYYNTGKIVSMGVSEKKDFSYVLYETGEKYPYICANKYVVSQKFRGEYVEDGSLYGKYEPDLFTFEVYDIESGKQVNAGDILSILEGYDNDFKTLRFPDLFTAKDDGNYYLGTQLTEAEDEFSKNYLYINLVNNESFMQSDFQTSDDDNQLFSNAFAQNSIIESLFQANHMKVDLTCRVGYCNIEVSASVLPQNNNKLYEMFPALKNVAQEGKNIIIGCTDNPSAEKFINLLLEDGQEISFEDVVLPARCSIDGKEHEIHSFDEFNQYVKKTGHLNSNK